MFTNIPIHRIFSPQKLVLSCPPLLNNNDIHSPLAFYAVSVNRSVPKTSKICFVYIISFEDSLYLPLKGEHYNETY